MSNENEIRTVPESYARALGSSNLKHNAEHRTDVDLLTAAGWNRSRVGAALMRLQAEWDSCVMARPLGREHFDAACLRDALHLAARELAEAGSVVARKAMEKDLRSDAKQAAAGMATEANLKAARALAERLRTMSIVLLQLRLQLSKWKLSEGDDVARAVLFWWLQRTCRECNATGFSIKTARACKGCGGSGETRPPCGPAGVRLANYMDDCAHRAAQFMGKVLRGRR